MFQATHGASGDMQFILKPDDLVALVKTVNHKNVGIVLDTWSWQLGAGTMDGIRQLNLDKVFEVRLADLPPGATADKVERTNRQEPGTRPDSLAQATLDWLKENDFPGPVALNANVPKSAGNAGDLPIQRIGKALDQMIAGTHGQDGEPVAESDDEEVIEVGTA
jgi:sugar phosphate isomerase/epimerase